MLGWIGKIASSVDSDVKGAFNDVVQSAENTVSDAAKSVAHGAEDVVKKGGEMIGHGLEDAAKFIIHEIEKLLKTIINDVEKGASDIKDYVKYMKAHPSEPLISPKDAIKKMPANIRPVADLVSDVGETVKYGKGFINTLKKSYKEGTTDIKQTFSKKDKTKTKEVAFNEQPHSTTEEHPFAPPTSPKPPKPY